MMRDYQRTRLYDAERSVHQSDYYNTCLCPARFEKVAEIEDFANDLYRTRTAEQIRLSAKGPLFKAIRVKDGRGRRSAAGGGGAILMPRWSRCSMVVAHEIMHNLLPRTLSAHGQEFANGLYRLTSVVDDWYGTDMAVKLGTAFEAGNIDW